MIYKEVLYFRAEVLFSKYLFRLLQFIMWFDISKGQAKTHGTAYSPWQAFSEQRIMNRRDS